jgi:hypothetical protein
MVGHLVRKTRACPVWRIFDPSFTPSASSRSCSVAWCSWRRVAAFHRHGPDRSAGDCRKADGGIMVQRRDGFQAHVAAALDGPFIVLFEQQGADQAGDGVLVGEDATTSVRRLISPLRRSSGLMEWIFGRWSFGKVVNASTSASASSISAASLGSLGRSGSATLRHCAVAASASSWAKAAAMKAETTRRPRIRLGFATRRHRANHR